MGIPHHLPHCGEIVPVLGIDQFPVQRTDLRERCIRGNRDCRAALRVRDAGHDGTAQTQDSDDERLGEHDDPQWRGNRISCSRILPQPLLGEAA
jgi:hypothetical protein